MAYFLPSKNFHMNLVTRKCQNAKELENAPRSFQVSVNCGGTVPVLNQQTTSLAAYSFI